MKVAIVTEEDLFYVKEFFEQFYKLAEREDYEISGVTILPPFNKKSTFALAKQMFGFYGPFHFLRVGTLYVFKKILKQTIRKLTEKKGYNIVDVTSANSDEYLKWIRENKIDLIISVAAPEIFRKPLLESVPMGIINSHSSLLPENRGMMPVFWGLYKGSDEIGVTIHSMEEKLDAGEILLQEKVSVTNESLDDMIIKTKRISAKLMNDTIIGLKNGTIKGEKVADGGSIQTFPTPAEVREFKKRGKRLF